MARDPDARWADLSGRIEAGKHILALRVYHEDTDFTGLVYHANYLKFCERGRSDFLRVSGIGQSELFAGEGGKEPAAFVVRHMDVDFLQPARMDDVLEIVTHVDEIGAAAMTLRQDVTRDGAVLVTLRVKIVLISGSGKPRRLGALVRSSLERFVNQEG